MFRAFHQKRKNDEGFTLIELLVVILIIAILAAIAIPVFLRQREKGWISQMESALKNAATAAESYATGPGDGSYTGLDEAKLTTEGWKKASEVNGVVVNVDATGNKYCVQVSHSKYSGASEPMGISSDSTSPNPGTCAAGVFTAPAAS
jgi:type IV pilus assembly protein PilA